MKIVEWVPMLMSIESIKLAFQNIFIPALKTVQRNCQDGLISGVRILIMENSNLESNPIPRYVHINGNQPHVTYDGQNIICNQW